MASTFASIKLHIVFSTKERRPFLKSEYREPLYRYFSGLVAQRKGHLIIAGGTHDHVHMLVGWHCEGSISDLMRDTKTASSKWLKREFNALTDFAWQRGYGVFSVSESVSKRVINYIETQEEHHRHFSYQDELRKILRAHRLDFDERYMWT
jgi:REP element-mobilizing transposase RayT